MNSEDRRMDRMVATTVMLMEALDGFSHKYDYAITGHDGDSPIIPFVTFGKPPLLPADRLRVIEMMYYSTGDCGTGDHTLSAVEHAITEVLKAEADDYFVFLLSDANLAEYGVSAGNLAAILTSNKLVHAYAIFIAAKEVTDTDTTSHL